MVFGETSRPAGRLRSPKTAEAKRPYRTGAGARRGEAERSSRASGLTATGRWGRRMGESRKARRLSGENAGNPIPAMTLSGDNATESRHGPSSGAPSARPLIRHAARDTFPRKGGRGARADPPDGANPHPALPRNATPGSSPGGRLFSRVAGEGLASPCRRSSRLSSSVALQLGRGGRHADARQLFEFVDCELA